MALIIKGEMPKGSGCDGCEFQTSRCEQLDACTCHLFDGVINNFHNERHKDCPIIGEIPDEHGRLIDADKMARQFNYYAEVCRKRKASVLEEAWETSARHINEADTVIPASEGE